MIVIDSSALIAILFREDGSNALVDAVETEAHRLISAASVVESSIVAARRAGDSGPDRIRRLMSTLSLSAISVSEDQIAFAIEAFMKFGKSRHPARLNFGDCFSYALAAEQKARLLFKGNDFNQTDIDTHPASIIT